jgi:hypothetical protein
VHTVLVCRPDVSPAAAAPPAPVTPPGR